MNKMGDFFNEKKRKKVNLPPNSPKMIAQISVFDDMDQMTEAEVQHMLPLVNEQRREEALRYKHLFGQFCCLKSWLMLNELLTPLGINDLEMRKNQHGKPYLLHHPEMHFNLSHCKNGIAVVIGIAPVGIDIESFHRENEALVRRTMNEAEIGIIQSSPNPTAAFTKLWTQKEAVLKLRGTGIVNDLYGVLDDKGYCLESYIDEEKQYAWSVAYTN